jgi:hypothetical protein
MSRRWILGIGLLAVVALMAGGFAWGLTARDSMVTPVVAALDTLDPPPSWTLAHEQTETPWSADACSTWLGGGQCPRVTRSFVVDSTDTGGIYQIAKGVALMAGMEITRDFADPCPTRGTDTCSFEATAGGIDVWISVSEPGVDLADLGIADDSSSIVRVMASQDQSP